MPGEPLPALDAASYGEAFADVYDLWYDDPADTAAAVTWLADAAGPAGRVLEVGAGTGRLALPLAERVGEVVALDASPAMLTTLEAKAGAARVRTVLADAARLGPDAHPALAEPFDLVVVARNTLFGIWSEGGEAACLAGLASVTAAGGRLVVDAEVPVGGGGRRVEVRRLGGREVALRWEHLPERRLVRCGLLDGTGTDRRWEVRYAAPDLLDRWAAEAGLALRERWGGWDAATWDRTLVRHLSVYGHHANAGGGGGGTVRHVTHVAPNAR